MGGKRRAIKTQLVEESGALQPRQGGVGGTEFTTRERLLSFREDEKLGLGSRRDRSKKSDEARTLRQRNVSVALFPGKKKGRNAAEAVDVFVTPNEKAAKETRFAMSMLAYCEWGRKASDAVAINFSPDAKTYGHFPTLGTSVDCKTILPDPDAVDAFGNRPDKIQVWPIRPPIQLIGCKAVVKDSLHRRKDDGTYPAQTSRKLALMLAVSGVTRAMSKNRSAVRVACDGASDNKGGGKLKEAMDTMSGTNSIIENLMFSDEAASQAARSLESMGLLRPIEQLFDGRDLQGLLDSLTKARLERERIERKEGAARGAAKREMKDKADCAASERDEATERVAELAHEFDRITRKVDHSPNDIRRLGELKGLLEAAKTKEKEAKEAAMEAKRRFKEAAKRRGVEGAGADSLPKRQSRQRSPRRRRRARQPHQPSRRGSPRRRSLRRLPLPLRQPSRLRPPLDFNGYRSTCLAGL